MSAEAEKTITRIAEVAHAVAFQAGVGGMEIAGQIVSVLARRPELIDRFMEEGSELFIEGLMGAERGCLTFASINGEITSPKKLSAHLEVKKLSRTALQEGGRDE